MYRAGPVPAPLVIACIQRNLVAFDRRTGGLAWAFDVGDDISRLEVIGDRVFVGAAYRVACVGYATGAPIWSVRSPVYVHTFFVDGDEIFVAGAGEVAAFSAIDGRLLWHNPLKGWGQFPIGFAAPGKAAQIDGR